MADLQQLESALRKADAAGDTYAAGRFAQEIRALQSKPSTGDIIAGMPVTRFAMGAASPLIAAAQGGAHIGDKINEMMGVEPMVSPWIDKKLQEYEAAKNRGMKAAGNEGYDFMGLFGSLIPGAAVAKGVTQALPTAQSVGTRMLTGAAAGGATAAAQPVASPDFWTDKAKQAMHGGAFGAAIPLATQGVLAGKAMFEPFYQKGREAIIGRTLRTASGGQADDVANALAQAREIVPGSQPTVGQAAGNAGIASLERATSAISPESTVAHNVRATAQNEARAAALASVAKDENARLAAEQARKAATAGPLQQLNQSTAEVDPQRTVSLIDGLIEKSSGRSKLTNALENIKKTLFKDDGTLRSNAAQLYQGARKNITDMLAEKAGDGSKVNEAISRELTVVMKSLDHQINKAEPAYGQFMQKYAETSRPINQMDIGQEVQKKATNSVGKVNLDPLVSALSDKTAQRATGFKRATLEGVMDPAQMQTLNNVKEDLIRAVQAERMAGTAGSDTVKKLAYSNLVDRAGVPTFLREFAPTQAAGGVLARGMDSLYGGANRDIAAKLAETMLNPKDAARMMRQVGPSRYAAMIEALMMTQAPGAAGVVAGRNPE
jgi:hypothetical protein